MEPTSIAHRIEAKERTDDVRLKELAPFSKMLLSESVRKGLYAAGFVYPTVIQATAIPVGKSGIDLLVQSKSGTGKTLIFSTIVLEFYQSELRDPQSLIVAPTREIAVQIEETLNELGKYCTGFRAVCVIGGMDVAEDRKRLQMAKCVVGTPGRILHLIQNEVLNTSQIAILVLDEADKMYTHTFRQDLQRIRKSLPNRKQTIACSATFIDNLDQELAKIMKNPLLISTEERATLLVGIKQFIYELPEQKTSILEMHLKLEALKHIFGRVAFKQCLIFAGSQSRADSYCNYLEKDGWPCELISGAQNQKTRLENFRKFREFKTRILIATDLMARGVDSEHVNLVINLELPTDIVTYLHRIGRAGRFGSHGLAVNFVASSKDHATFKKLITDVGTGMQVLKFPVKDQPEKEPRDLWYFVDFAEDAKHFGLYQNNTQKMLAPLASQDNVTLTSSLSDNKENLTDNISSNQNSSIDTNTFLVNSNDSALQVPKLYSEQLPVQQIVLTVSKNEGNIEEVPQLATLPPPPNPSENPNTVAESHNSSSHPLLTSNTIDDASSIAADSLRSSQQDISRYQSVLMQKSAIPTLVEFLVDRHSSQESQTKNNGETCTKIDLFDAYTKEVLNNNESVTEPAVTFDDPQLSTTKLAQLKSLLIDKPNAKSPIDDLQDPYSDFANFQEDEISTSVSENIDKQTFILSVATPSIQQDSYSELQNNSSDLYPATDTTNISTADTPREEKEQKHFPSPVHNQTIVPPEVMPDILKASNQKNKSQPHHKILQQKLSINKTAQIEIPPYPSPPNSVSPLMIALHDAETNSSPSSGSSTATSAPEENLHSSASEVELNGNSSGFDEKTSTSGSSGIESSEHNDGPARPQQILVYYTPSEDDSNESDDEAEEEDSDDDESEHYYLNTDNNDDEDEDDDDEDDDDANSDENDEEDELTGRENNADCAISHNPDSSILNTSTNATPTSLNLAYQTAYSRWVDLYWNQMTLVQDYVKFFNFTRQHQQNE